MEVDPVNGLARFNLGCVHDRLGDTETAIAEFRMAIALVPHMADAHLNLALAYDKLGNKDDALVHLEHYLRDDPQGPWAEYARLRLDAHRRLSRGGSSKVTPFRRNRR